MRTLRRALGTVAFARAAVFTLGLALPVAALADSARPLSPLAWPECLDRSDLMDDLTRIGAEPWERSAIAGVTSGRIGKGPVDYVRVSADEVAIGWAHLTTCRWGRFGWLDCPANASSLDDYWTTLAVLYSDVGPRVQLDAWRSLVSIADSPVRHCDDPVRAVVAAAANSSPRRARLLAERCGCHELCVAKGYGTSPRRRARMTVVLSRYQ